MGVINITPNSFSDANKNLNSENLKSNLNEFLSFPNLAFDFGFESTAPMNSAISFSEEKKRFDHFFEQIKDVDLSGRWISFDTYKLENFLYFESQFQSRYKDCGYILNDVSGVIDDELLLFLKNKNKGENFYYVYCCTHIPSRGFVLNHTQFIKEEDIIEGSFNNFKRAYELFKDLGMKDKIIFDPCFGFSKSYEQNWDLINRFDLLVLKLEEISITAPWVIGISKKSFLRKSLPLSIDPFADSEILHAKIIKNFCEKQLGHLIFRVHDPKLVVF